MTLDDDDALLEELGALAREADPREEEEEQMKGLDDHPVYGSLSEAENQALSDGVLERLGLNEERASAPAPDTEQSHVTPLRGRRRVAVAATVTTLAVAAAALLVFDPRGGTLEESLPPYSLTPPAGEATDRGAEPSPARTTHRLGRRLEFVFRPETASEAEAQVSATIVVNGVSEPASLSVEQAPEGALRARLDTSGLPAGRVTVSFFVAAASDHAATEWMGQARSDRGAPPGSVQRFDHAFVLEAP